MQFLISWLFAGLLLLNGSRPCSVASSYGWLVAAVISSVLGLVQYLGWASHLGPWANPSELGVAFANLRQRNHFATLTSMGLFALLWCAVQSDNLQQKSSLRRMLPIVAVLLAAGNAASSSRTGLFEIGLIVCVACLWGWLRTTQTRMLLVIALATYAMASLGLPLLAGLDPASGVFGRLQEAQTCASRLNLWSNVLHLISQKPALGWGWGELDYAHYVATYDNERFCGIADNAHNLPLHLAVELGIPAAALLCSGLVWLGWRARPWRETDLSRQLAWGMLSILILHSLLEYPLWYGPFQITMGLCLLMLWPESATVAAAQTSPPFQWGLPARGALTASATAFLLYAAWDYRRISQIYLVPQARSPAYREDTLNKIRGSWLFRDQVRFAELTTTPLRPNNAQWTFDTATALLHYSPEPRVIEKVIESAVMLGRDDEALLHLARYRAAFPKEHEKWRNANALPGRPSF